MLYSQQGWSDDKRGVRFAQPAALFGRVEYPKSKDQNGNQINNAKVNPTKNVCQQCSRSPIHPNAEQTRADDNITVKSKCDENKRRANPVYISMCIYDAYVACPIWFFSNWSATKEFAIRITCIPRCACVCSCMQETSSFHFVTQQLKYIWCCLDPCICILRPTSAFTMRNKQTLDAVSL